MPYIPDLTPAEGQHTPARPSVAAATAPARGLLDLGQGLTSTGQDIAQEQLHRQKAADDEALNTAALEWQKTENEIREFQQNNPDESTWEPFRKQRIDNANKTLGNLTLSPEGRQRLDQQTARWDEDSRHQVAMASSQNQRQRQRQISTDLSEQYHRNGQFDQARDAFARAPRHPDEIAAYDQELEFYREKKAKDDAYNARLAEIDADPFGQFGKYTTTEAPDGMDQDEWSRLRDHSRRRRSAEQNTIVDSIRDGIAGNRIVRPEELEQFTDELGESTVRQLQEGMRQSSAFGRKMLMALPSEQAKAIGEVATAIDAMDPDDIEARVRLENRLADITDGPSKSHLRAEFRKKLAGEPPDDTALGHVRGMVSQATSMGLLGPTRQSRPQTTADVVADDFLQDGAKLQQLGLTPDEADSIMKPELSDEKRLDLFRQLYPKRDRSRDSEVDSYTLAAAESLVSRNNTVQRSPEESARENDAILRTMLRRGQIEKQLIEWTKRNPGKDATPELYRLLGDSASEQLNSAITEPYGEPVMGEFFAPMPSSGTPTVPDLPSGQGQTLEILLPPLDQ